MIAIMQRLALRDRDEYTGTIKDKDNEFIEFSFDVHEDFPKVLKNVRKLQSKIILIAVYNSNFMQQRNYWIYTMILGVKMK